MLALSEDDVRRLLDLDLLIDALADAFVEVSAGRASVPPRVAASVPDGGFLAAMPGYVDGVLETKLVSVFPGNDELGLPTHQALIALFDADTGSPLAVMDGTHITAARTAAASALATPSNGQAVFFSRETLAERFRTGGLLLDAGVYKLDAGRREAPGAPEVHEREVDVVRVVQGRATIVTGGDIQGDSVEGGAEQALAEGDVIAIPAGVPHQFVDVSDPFLYFVVKVEA